MRAGTQEDKSTGNIMDLQTELAYIKNELQLVDQRCDSPLKRNVVKRAFMKEAARIVEEMQRFTGEYS